MSIVVTVGYYLIDEKKSYIFSLILFIVFNVSPLLIFQLVDGTLHSRSAYTYIIFYFSLAEVLIMLSLIIGSKAILPRRGVLFILSAVISLPALFFWGYYFSAHAWFNVEILMAILQTNIWEAKGYLVDHYSIWTLVAFAIFFFTSIAFADQANQISFINNKRTTLVWFVIFCLGNVYCLSKAQNNLVTSIFTEAQMYLQRYNEFQEAVQTRQNLVSSYTDIKSNSSDGVYILVIGESANRTHMSAYGYERMTTPWMDSMLETNHACLFSNAYSCHVQTVPALAYALTAKNQYNDILLEQAVSLVEIANAAGYHTVWISNQGKYGGFNTPVSVIGEQANQQIWLNRHIDAIKHDVYDMKLCDALKTIDTSSRGILVILHLMGSHGDYRERVPKEYVVFSGDQKEWIDEYDNSILYTDEVLKNVWEWGTKIKNFQGMLYFSDHSEELDKKLGHDPAIFDPAMTTIPLVFWFSDDYQKHHATTTNVLKSHVNEYFTNDLIFDLMLGIMGIEINTNQKDNDLSNEMYNDDSTRFRTLYGTKRLNQR